nr:FAD-binding oxidoreductase [uncultured Psychrobacter sp.]
MTANQHKIYQEKSFWLQDYGHYKPNLALDTDISADVCIIGGGFSGLSTAFEFKKINPNARVVVIESAIIGYGASGRNGGFSMKLFGLEPEITVLRWGEQKTIDAHQYMIKAVNHVQNLVHEHEFESDYQHTGMFRVAYSDRQAKRLSKTYELFQKLGLDGDMSWQPKQALAQAFKTDKFFAGMYETQTGLLNPCKQVRELKRICLQVGVDIYETTPALDIEESRTIKVTTPNGRITSDKLVIATNGYSHNVPSVRLKNHQLPVWTYQVVTQPLTPEQWDAIGWHKRQAFEDNRQLVHYFRPTADGRITMGGGRVAVAYGNDMDKDSHPKAWQHCEEHLKWIYPQLQDVKIAYRWGGPTSVNLDMTPEIGYLNSNKIIYTCGCIGHGVSLTHLNGKLIAQLLSEQNSDLTDFWIVNRKAIRLPGDILSWCSAKALTGALTLVDKFEERGL